MKKAKNVKNEKDFIAFLQSLHKDIVKDTKRKKKEWANKSIEAYLEAMIAAYEAHGSESEFFSADNVWCKVAKILEMGKYYE